MSLDSLSARSAAHRSWGMTRDRRARTAPARDAANRRFVTEARGLLGDAATDAEVEQAAASLRKAWFADLARKSAAARATGKRAA